jgi:hypothetical protein
VVCNRHTEGTYLVLQLEVQSQEFLDDQTKSLKQLCHTVFRQAMLTRHHLRRAIFSNYVVPRRQYFVVTGIIIQPCFSYWYDINEVLKRFEIASNCLYFKSLFSMTMQLCCFDNVNTSLQSANWLAYSTQTDKTHADILLVRSILYQCYMTYIYFTLWFMYSNFLEKRHILGAWEFGG